MVAASDGQLICQHGPHHQQWQNSGWVFHGAGIQGSWSLQGFALPQSLSFKLLGLVFHEMAGLGPMLRQLHSAGQSARAKPEANFGLQFRLHHFCAHAAEAFRALIAREVWGSQLQGRIDADARKLQGVQRAFLRSICDCLSVNAPMPAIAVELALCAMGPACAFCSIQGRLTEKPSVCMRARIACLRANAW